MTDRSLLRWVALVVGALVLGQRAMRWLRSGDPTEGPGGPDPQWMLAGSWIPLALLLVALVVSWWRPMVGAVTFLGYFVLYVGAGLAQHFPYIGAVAFTSVFAASYALVGTLLLAAVVQERHQSRSSASGPGTLRAGS